MINKLKVSEAIICEGRDDTINILRALDCMTIETHGFGITEKTWGLIEKAYKEQGIIIFTDPDYSGEEIRRKIKKKFPNSKEAFLTIDEATKNGDIGIENADPIAIIEAIKKAHYTKNEKEDEFSEKDIALYGLSGRKDSAEMRMKIGKILGIGYSNSKTFLKKLNNFDIKREEFLSAIKELEK